MSLVLNEEQRMLKDSATEFLGKSAPVDAFRALRDSQDEQGYCPKLWQEIVNLGWSAITIPENYGGLDFGFKGMGAVFEAMGHYLTSSPLFSSAVLGASLVELQGSETQKNDILPQVASGELKLALALEENTHHSPESISLIAEANETGFLLNGVKQFVLDGHIADYILVVAKTQSDSTDLTIFMLPTDHQGISIQRTSMFDSKNAAIVTLNQVQVNTSHVLGTMNTANQALEETLDRGRAILCTEMLGGSIEMFQRTVEYLKEREQFGVKIGSFQALKHRASQMFIQLELAKSVVMAALNAVDEKVDNRAHLVSVAKVKMNETFSLITDEATQMHGGIGVTDELDVGLFLKRARVCAQTLGNEQYHIDRFAKLNQF